MPTATTPKAICPNCGEQFSKLKDGAIPTHDFPKPCRSVCKGSGAQPRGEKDDRPLWKDKPEQQSIDFFDDVRVELLLYGFAAIKQLVLFSGQRSGIVQCPLCLKSVKFVIASNDHCHARCETTRCINAME